MNKTKAANNTIGIIGEFRRLGKLWPYLRQDKPLLLVAAAAIPIIATIEMFIPITVRRSIDDGIAKQDWHTLKIAAASYLGLVVLQYLVRSVQSLAAAFSVHRMMLLLRRKLINHVLGLKSSYHDHSLSGTLVTRATSDFDNLAESLNTGVLTSVIDFAVLIGSFIGLLYLNWIMALSAMLVVPAVLIVVTYFSKWLKAAMMRARIKIAELNAFTQECLYGNSTIKLLNAQSAAMTKHNRLADEYRKAQLSSVFLDAVMFSIIDGLTSITIGLVIYLALAKSSLTAGVTTGVMVAFVQYIQQMFEPIKQLSNKIAMLQGAFTSIERIFSVLDTDAVITGSYQPESCVGNLSFKNLSFAYQRDKQPGNLVLHDINFTVRAGQSLALVGATGSGKSSIIKLIAKLYDGYQGAITLDGRDLRDIDGHWLRQQIALVPQDIVLFDGTIAFNISLGAPGITEQDIVEAATRVGADRFIREFADGYQQQVREQGQNLSHGMRQLIAFSRALVKRPKLIMLDEATASVDPITEAAVQRGIATLLKGHTVIVVAHRLSTIQHCDQILVIDKGRIVESGTHNSLLAQSGAYAKLLNNEL